MSIYYDEQQEFDHMEMADLFYEDEDEFDRVFDWDRHRFVVWTWGRLNVFHPSRVDAASRNALGHLVMTLRTPKERVVRTMNFERLRFITEEDYHRLHALTLNRWWPKFREQWDARAFIAGPSRRRKEAAWATDDWITMQDMEAGLRQMPDLPEVGQNYGDQPFDAFDI